ncbi:D-glycerate dehydrogenase [Curvibacter sp. APW13]|uniref:2-hydroxyacid dehydrogenase n=1 Tax=Curvibacter sp. APW13 TaxID=3077236 RepID=UPI0028DEDE31|nr:D-glycerate dehydrogenase [Curvibacter sp. APW13]MDT8992255.1 D-glycerate dehydrogenase [Curvibacter sp. APW13]
MTTEVQPLRRILVAQPVFEEVLERLRAHFDVVDNQSGQVWSGPAWVQRLQGFDGVMCFGVEPINAEVLAQCPGLRICANMTVGYNNFDVPAMTTAGVLATNAPDVLTETTADFGFALLLATARRVCEGERFLRDGRWERWRYDMLAGADVHGTTLGIVGMGRIGQAIARRAALGFGMRVIYHNRSRLAPAVEQGLGAQWLGLGELLAQADHVMLVVPYSAQTHHLIGAAELAHMKPTATLVNIARGGVVDDAALAEALVHRRIAAAGLDVFEGEPAVHPALLAAPNAVLTPHIASASIPTRRAMAELAADNLIAYFSRGEARTPLNIEVLSKFRSL